MRKYVVIGGILGIGIFVWLIVRSDWREIAEALVMFNWKILPVTIWYFIPAAIDTAAWRVLYLPENRPPWILMYWARWVAMSLNTLLPTAQVAGHAAGVRIVGRSGKSPGTIIIHAATVTADVTIGIVAQIVFTIISFLLLYPYSGGSGLSWRYWAGVWVAAILAALLVISQHHSPFARIMARIRRASEREQAREGRFRAEELDAEVVDIYRRKKRILATGAIRLAGWISKAGESYLALYFLGFPITVTGAVIIEGITLAVMKAAFFIPGGIGAREAAIVVVGNIIGIPMDMAMSFAIIKRVREVFFGVPGILSWLAYEGRLTAKGG